MEERRLNIPFLVTAIVLVAVIVFGIVFYINTSNNFTTDRNSVSNLKAQVTTLQSQLNLANTTAATLDNNLTAAKNQISKLEGQVTTGDTQLNTLINTLTTQIKAANDQITALQALQKQLTDMVTQVNSLKNDSTAQTTKITALETSLNTLTTTLNTLKTTVTTLSNQVTNLTTIASSPVVVASSISVSATNAAPQQFASYVSPTYSGYVQVQADRNLTTGIVKVYNSSTTNFLGDYAFNGGSAVNIPISPGIQYLFYFGNSATSGTITAALSATFFPGASGGGNQTTLFSNSPVSQAYGASTVVKNFTTTTAGYVTISGTSNNASTYVELYNLTAPGASESAKVFGVGPTSLNFNVMAGANYDIKFWNLNSGSGTVAATLTGVYNRY